ncbi:MAG: hypothetical protein V3V08_14625 [Nannocystaceae bacterium]
MVSRNPAAALASHRESRGSADLGDASLHLSATRWICGLLAVAGASACTESRPRRRFPLVEKQIQVHSTAPRRGEIDVEVDVRIDICFSDLINPLAVDDFHVSVSSGQHTYDTQIAIQLFAWRAPGSDEPYTDADAPWCPGSVLSVGTNASLRPGLMYRARLRAFPLGWQGEGMDTTTPGWTSTEDGDKRFFLEFTIADATEGGTATGSTPSAGDMAESSATGDMTDTSATGRPPLTLIDLFASGSAFDPDTGYCSCHVSGDPLARLRLDLSSPERAWRDLVLQTNPAATGFPMVSPRRASSSYLIHSLLRQEDGRAIRGVVGDPMPPNRPLPYRHMVDIARWIESGAHYD